MNKEQVVTFMNRHIEWLEQNNKLMREAISKGDFATLQMMALKSTQDAARISILAEMVEEANK